MAKKVTGRKAAVGAGSAASRTRKTRVGDTADRRRVHDAAAFRGAAQDLMDYIAVSPSQFHAAAESIRRLEEVGFSRLFEEDAWDLGPGHGYFTVRNDSSVAAWIQGAVPASEAGFRMIGAHTDSPSLRLKPEPVIERHGYVQLGIEVYGGPILPAWMDTEMGLAGRVAVAGPGGSVESRLLNVDRPVATAPQLAIHLNREVNEKGLQVNAESHLAPILTLSGEKPFDFAAWLARELGVRRERILDHEIYLYDRTRPAFIGLEEEFIRSPRIDNLAGCHAALSAILAAFRRGAAATRLIVLYDNEEIGSSTKQGAAGSFQEDLLGRIAGGGDAGSDALYRAKARSFLISADLAHAVHPNYADRHEPRHMPRLNGGPVIKYNAKARYATDAPGGALFQTVCREAGVPCQRFVMRADLPCGSTIGPLAETRLGIRTVDVGSPVLAMHSSRELGGAKDQLYMIRAMERFFA